MSIFSTTSPKYSTTSYSATYSPSYPLPTTYLLSPTSTMLSPIHTPLTLNLEYSRPLVGIYGSIDNYPEVRLKMLNYYYDLVRDKWLLDEFSDILNYFTFQNGKVDIVKTIDEYKPTNINDDTDEIAEKKVDYIAKYVFTKYNLTELISNFTTETRTKWVDLPKNEFFLKKYFKEYLVREIRKKIKKSGTVSDKKIDRTSDSTSESSR